jgi:outer membrane protein assembly factor BamB
MRRWHPLILSGVVAACGADWAQFRGPGSACVATGAAVPTEFGPGKNIAWKVDLPGRGLSSPIVVRDRVFLTAADGPKQDRLHVLAFDARTGARLWRRTFWATGPTHSHPKTSMAAPTPVSNGRHVVALFATNDLVCLDLAGNVLWLRALYEENPGATDGRGLASSPLLVGSTVVVHVEGQNVSFAAGINVETGANRWRVSRPRQMNWSSPIRLAGEAPADDLVLLQGSTRLSACDPATGREVWGLEHASHPIASSVLAGNHLYVPGEAGLTAYELQPRPAAPKVLWEKPTLAPSMASPVVFGDRVYVLRGPILVTADARNGTVVGRLRLKGAFSSTPVAAGGLLYCFNEDGLCHVVRPDAKGGRLVHSAGLEETVLCTPAVADGAMYVRSDRHLWKIARS